MDISKLSETMKSVMDLAYEGIIVVDHRGVITMVNQVYAEFFNSNPEAMVGKHVSEAYCNSMLSRLPIVLKTGKPEIGRFFTLNGRQVMVSRIPVMEEGKVIGAVGKVMFRDLEFLDQLLKRTCQRKGVNFKDCLSIKEHKYDIDRFIGHSDVIIDLKETIRKIAIRNSTVLIRGESGTGKEVLAHGIHLNSNRRFGPLIKVNCAAIPDNLLESELFGYVDGAFTGAKRGGLVGKFELADKGTIFLDEIGDMPLAMQAKLLRVIQDREVQPLGASKPRKIDVRIVAATNVKLEELIAQGKFREDLYYRINVVMLNIPPLRERKEDISDLLDFFIVKFNREFGLSINYIEPQVIEIFRNYSWPGNVRELENVLERIYNIIDDSSITVHHLPHYLLKYLSKNVQGELSKEKCSCMIAKNEIAKNEISKNMIASNMIAKNTGVVFEDESKVKVSENKFTGSQSLTDLLEKAERDIIMQALAASNGNKVQAANLLGVSRPGLYKKLDKYGIV